MAATAPARAAAGPSSSVTGSPRWFVRVQRSAPPGGLRVRAVYAARAAAAAITAVTAGATARRALAIYFFPFDVVLVPADGEPLGVGAGLGPADVASDWVP